MAKSQGFTLIEAIVVMGLMAILIGLAAVNLLGSQRAVVSDSAANTMIADLRTQQIKAMMGDDNAGSTAQAYGVFFKPNSYVLFAGNSYSASDPTNFEVTLDGLTLSTSFPSSRLIFNKAAGDVNGFTAGQNTITFTNSVGEQTVLNVNRYGVVNVQ